MATATASSRADKAGARSFAALARRLRYIPLGIGAAAMGLGFWLGLLRLGVDLPGGMPSIAEFHGALMICGFLGTLISLERAVALGQPWSYSAPGLSAAGTVVLMADQPRIAMFLFIAASLMLVVASATVFIRQRAGFTFVLLIAAVAWGIGTAEWLIGHPMPDAASWWLAFLILTIVAERVELSRLAAPPPWAQALLAPFLILILVGDARAELGDGALRFTSVGLIGCAAWLLWYDIARRTIRKDGQVRFTAACLLLGHVWLGIAGVLGLLPPAVLPLSYDAVIHTITIGFVLSMIFGHAPIILPAVTGLRVRYHAFAWLPLALLHFSVILRVASDFNEWTAIRSYAGILTVLALASYAATLIVASLRGAPVSPAH